MMSKMGSSKMDNSMRGFVSMVRLQCIATVILLLISSMSVASESAVEAVRQVVAKNVEEVLAKYEQEKPFFETDPKRFYLNMDAALSQIVDFRRIAARVMGKYARRATKTQRGRFSTVFKSSLFETYTKTLVESGSFKINVVKAALNSRSDKRASVDLSVVSESGNVYPVTYSMYFTKDGQWLMENVIVFGVNVGLAFKDKFEAQFRVHKGDIDAVIDNWSVKIDLESAQEG